MTALFSHCRCDRSEFSKHGKLQRAERQTAVVLHQQLQSVTPPPQPSGSDLFTETNTRLIECVFCVEKKLTERFSVQPSVRESQKNGNQDLCSHTGDFDTLKAGMRSRGLTSRQSSREAARSGAAEKQPTKIQVCSSLGPGATTGRFPPQQ